MRLMCLWNDLFSGAVLESVVFGIMSALATKRHLFSATFATNTWQVERHHLSSRLSTSLHLQQRLWVEMWWLNDTWLPVSVLGVSPLDESRWSPCFPQMKGQSCWWFRNPARKPLEMLFCRVNNGINSPSHWLPPDSWTISFSPQALRKHHEAPLLFVVWRP